MSDDSSRYSLENWMGAIAILSCLSIVTWLAWSITHSGDDSKPPPPTNRTKLEIEQMTIESTIKDARARLATILEDIHQIERDIKTEASSLFDPGPEPSIWLHPIDYLWWAGKKNTFDTTQSKIRNLKEHLGARLGDKHHVEIQERDSVQRQSQILNQVQQIDEQSFGTGLWVWAKHIWNAYIIPIMHLLMLWAIVCLLSRLVFRLMLINDRLRPVRV